MCVNGASRSEYNHYGASLASFVLVGCDFSLCFEMKNKELLDNIVLTTITEDAGRISFIYPCRRYQNEHTLDDSTNIERQEGMRHGLFLFFSNQMRPKTTIV